MGTLDQPTGTVTKKQIKILDLTGFTIPQIEDAFNNTYGIKGWSIIQVFTINSKNYLLAERII